MSFLANTEWLVYGAIILSSSGGLVAPSVQGALSSRVAAEEQGLLQGSLAGINNLTNVVAPLLTAGLFAYVVARGASLAFIGTPLFVCALIELSALVGALRGFRPPQTFLTDKFGETNVTEQTDKLSSQSRF